MLKVPSVKKKSNHTQYSTPDGGSIPPESELCQGVFKHKRALFCSLSLAYINQTDEPIISTS